jgi:hypothetical protein
VTSALRYLRQVVAPTGRHRKPPEPTPPQAEPVPHKDGTDAPESTGASDE